MILKHLHLWMKKHLTTLKRYYSEDDDYDLFGADYDDDDLFDATADLLSNHPEREEVMRRWMIHSKWM